MIFQKHGQESLEECMTKRRILHKVWIVVLVFLISGVLTELQGEISIVKGQNLDQENTKSVIMEKINSHRDSIVRVESICWNGEDTIYQKKVFSGFIVSKDTSGVYVVTIHNNLMFSTEEKEAIEETCKEELRTAEEARLAEEQAEKEQKQQKQGEEKSETGNSGDEYPQETEIPKMDSTAIDEYKIESNVHISEKIEVIFNGDLRIKASISGESEQRNLTILKLEQAVNFDSILQFPEDGTVHKNSVYLLGYPRPADGKETVCINDNVKITVGERLGEFQQDDVSFFIHNIQADQGCIGGPLLYEDGLLAGVLLNADGEAQGTAITGESLKSFLATFKIPYEEHQTVRTEKKVPILNIVLGFLIGVLMIFILFRAVKGKERSGSRKEKKVRGKKTSGHCQTVRKQNHSGQSINASIEYPAEKRIVLIRKGRFLIGRTNEADLFITENKGISRKHACITWQKGEFYLSDLDSTNHTFLNGSELLQGEKRMLKNGDQIMVGKEILIFYRS